MANQAPTQRTTTTTGTASTRRDFMRTSTAAAAAAALSTYVIPQGVFAKADESLKVGLVGCGGRGNGAAVNALTADGGAKLVAMGDMFEDYLEAAHETLLESDVAEQIHEDDMKKFTGWDAYKGVIDASDVVILATPPHFRPLHLRAAIDAGKHVFCEKPVAVDVPGVKKVMEACRVAKEKGLNVVSGLCFRYDESKAETIKRVHDGQIGKIVTLQANYNSSGLWNKPRKPDWDDMQYQLRNWLYHHWLSGDHVVEQAIHSIDKAMWAMNDKPPMKVSAAGGRTQRTDPAFGHIYDHFNSVIEWQDGTRCYQSCRQWNKTDTDLSDLVFGADGMANIQMHELTGKNAWKGKEAKVHMYEAEHRALFKAIRKNAPIVNEYMNTSTLLAIMVRMSAYTGRTIYWDKAAAEAARAGANAAIIMKSVEDLTPPKYEFGPLPVAPVAVPGVTPFK